VCLCLQHRAGFPWRTDLWLNGFFRKYPTVCKSISNSSFPMQVPHHLTIGKLGSLVRKNTHAFVIPHRLFFSRRHSSSHALLPLRAAPPSLWHINLEHDAGVLGFMYALDSLVFSSRARSCRHRTDFGRHGASLEQEAKQNPLVDLFLFPQIPSPPMP